MIEQVQMGVLEEGEGFELEHDNAAEQEEIRLVDRRFLNSKHMPLEPILEASNESCSIEPNLE